MITGKMSVAGTLTGTMAQGQKPGGQAVLQTKVVSSIPLGNNVITPDSGYDGLSMLTVTSSFREMHYPQNFQVDTGEVWLYAPDGFDPTSYSKIRFKSTSGADLAVYNKE